MLSVDTASILGIKSLNTSWGRGPQPKSSEEKLSAKLWSGKETTGGASKAGATFVHFAVGHMFPPQVLTRLLSMIYLSMPVYRSFKALYQKHQSETNKSWVDKKVDKNKKVSEMIRKFWPGLRQESVLTKELKQTEQMNAELQAAFRTAPLERTIKKSESGHSTRDGFCMVLQ